MRGHRQVKLQLRDLWNLCPFFLLEISNSHSEFWSSPWPFLASQVVAQTRARNGSLHPLSTPEYLRCSAYNHDGEGGKKQNTTKLYWGFLVPGSVLCNVALIFTCMILPWSRRTRDCYFGIEERSTVFLLNLYLGPGVKKRSVRFGSEQWNYIHRTQGIGQCLSKQVRCT